MITGYCSLTAFEVDLMAEVNMPYLMSSNANVFIGIVGKQPNKYPTVWNTVPSYDAYQTELPRVIEQWAKSEKLSLKNRKLAMVMSNNPYSKSIGEGLIDNFDKYGWKTTVREMVPFGEVHDWRAIIAKIRKDPPDVVVNTDYQPGNEATFLSQFMENPTKSIVFMQYGPSVPEFIELTADISTGVLYNILGGPIISSQLTKSVAEKFENEYGNQPGTYGHQLYWQIYVYAKALEKVGDPAKRLEIGEAIGKTDMEVSAGRLVFDQHTHLATQGDDYIPLTFFQIWEGERYLLSPAKYATGEFRLPAHIQ